jgi:hypothetical protein
MHGKVGTCADRLVLCRRARGYAGKYMSVYGSKSLWVPLAAATNDTKQALAATLLLLWLLESSLLAVATNTSSRESCKNTAATATAAGEATAPFFVRKDRVDPRQLAS